MFFAVVSPLLIFCQILTFNLEIHPNDVLRRYSSLYLAGSDRKISIKSNDDGGFIETWTICTHYCE